MLFHVLTQYVGTSFFVLSQIMRLTDRRTDGRTDSFLVTRPKPRVRRSYTAFPRAQTRSALCCHSLDIWASVVFGLLLTVYDFSDWK